MNFLPDVYVLCEVCNGRRYNQETLTVKFNGYSIADLLDLPIEDAVPILKDIPSVHQKLQTLVDVGLGYIHLGQSATTLFDDVRKLLEGLHRLTDLGNTVVIIEHNLDIIRNADYLIDMGPEGGEGGGRIVAQGPPEAVARVAASHTGYFLARYYASAGTLDAADHLPPIDLPDFEKKPPKPKFIKPEKKTGLPTASKNKPEPTAKKTPAKKPTKKAAK